jgi:hypothetical protein
MYEEDLFSGYDPYKGMTDEERVKACLLHVISTAVGVIIVIIACALLGGCTTTKYVPVVEHHTDTLIHTQHQRDSIYVHDSTYVRDNGDTVLIERWHTRWRDRWQHDTLYISKTDSVPKPYPVEVVKEVPRERSTVEWVLLITGVVAITFIVLSILIWVKKHT